MEHGHLGGPSLFETRAQQIAEEMVIAVPTPLVVEGDNEQVCALEILQGGLPGSIQGGLPGNQSVEQNGIT